MTLAHPDITNVANLLREADLIPPSGGNIKEVREYLERINHLVSKDSVPLSCEQILEFTVNGRQIPCKLYVPDNTHKLSLLFHCHGGGFRNGTLAGWDAPLRQIVRESGVAVLSIGYALSPEYKFPVAFEEIVAILKEVIENETLKGHIFENFALSGDSAGANLALGAAIALRNHGVDALRYLLLFYGVYSKDVMSASWQHSSGYGGHGLSSKSMSAYWESYLENDESSWRVQPLHANLAHLPPSRIVVGELDPLLDENVALDIKLNAAGVSSSLEVLPGIIHGVFRFNELAPVVHKIVHREAVALKKALQ